MNEKTSNEIFSEKTIEPKVAEIIDVVTQEKFMRKIRFTNDGKPDKAFVYDKNGELIYYLDVPKINGITEEKIDKDIQTFLQEREQINMRKGRK